MSQDNYHEKREGRVEGRGKEREEERRWKREKGKERGTVNEHLCHVSRVTRLWGAVVKVTAFSQSLTLSPCSTVPQLCDPWRITKPLWASISSNVKWRKLPRVVWAIVRTPKSVPNHWQMVPLSAGVMLSASGSVLTSPCTIGSAQCVWIWLWSWSSGRSSPVSSSHFQLPMSASLWRFWQNQPKPFWPASRVDVPRRQSHPHLEGGLLETSLMLPPYWPPSLPSITPVLFWHLLHRNSCLGISFLTEAQRG